MNNFCDCRTICRFSGQTGIAPVGCDWDALPAALEAVDSACCLGLKGQLPWPEPDTGSAPASGSCSSGKEQCSMQCAVALLPLTNGTCAPL
eukprot:SAG31_NODE_733_length_12491_cov_7.073112_2_plen_91_part_00